MLLYCLLGNMIQIKCSRVNASNLQQAGNTACRGWVPNGNVAGLKPSRGRQYFLPVADWTHSLETSLSIYTGCPKKYSGLIKNNV